MLFNFIRSRLEKVKCLKSKISEMKTKEAPSAIGPYSQGVRAGGFYFLSGQIALNTEGVLVGNTLEQQTEQIFKNIKAVLTSEGLDLANVVNTTVYLKDFNDFSTMNEVYKKQFEQTKNVQPARTTVEVSELPRKALIEISCIAYKT